MKRFTVDDILFACERACIHSLEQRAQWALDAIRWYIVTGRASVPWLDAVARANPDRLLTAMARSADASTAGMIETCHRYLKRYCRLTA